MVRPGPTSFEDLRTVDGTIYPSFAAAAKACGLLESDEIFIRAMKDACIEKMSLKRLQHYFAMLICHGQPSDPQHLFELFLDEMYPQPAANTFNRPLAVESRRSCVLRNLEYYFNCMGTSCRFVF